jgi:hypothetical protein
LTSINRNLLMILPVRDLRWFLQSKKIPNQYCNEKTELADLVMAYMLHSSVAANRSRPTNLRGSQSTSTDRPVTTATTTASTVTTPSSPSSDTTQQSNSDESIGSGLSSDWEIVDGIPTIDLSRRSSVNDAPSLQPRPQSADADNHDSLRNTPIDVPRPARSATLNPAAHALITEEQEQLSRSFDASRSPHDSSLPNELSKSAECLSNFRFFNINDLKSERDIRDLGVRQLKLLLTRNYVNYQGACEKEELQEKVIRLWKQTTEEKGTIFKFIFVIVWSCN